MSNQVKYYLAEENIPKTWYNIMAGKLRVCCLFQEAERCKQEGKPEVLLFNLCGHGNFDMQAYMDYSSGKLVDEDADEQELEQALENLPQVPA